MRAVKNVTQFHWCGIANEKIAAAMLENEEWMDDFLQKSRNRESEGDVGRCGDPVLPRKQCRILSLDRS